MSQDMSLSSRTSQQSSQEGSDPKLSNSYHTKPLLFGDLKDKSKPLGILDKFEEDKKRAKEKADSGILARECHHLWETLNSIQQLVAGTERNAAVCQTAFENFENFASTFQKSLNSLQSDVSQQFETLLSKVHSQREIVNELEEKVQKSGDATAGLGSDLQSLKNSLECLREEHERERKMFEEAVKLLSILVSEHSAKPRPVRVMDSAIQTSPGLEKPFSNILPENKLEGTQLMCISHNLEHNQVEPPPQDPSFIIGKRKSTLRGHRRCKKRPLVLSQGSKHVVTDENRHPLISCSKEQNVLMPFCEQRDPNAAINPDCQIPPNREMRSMAAGCFITPHSCWSQDSNSSACLAGVEPILEKLSAAHSSGTTVKAEGLWQLFDIDCYSDLGF